MKRTLIGFAILSVVLQVLTGAATEPNDFRFFKDVTRDSAEQECILSVVLDSAVYAAARPGYPDLRVFDAAGKESPFLVEKVVESKERSSREGCRNRIVSLHEQDNGIELVIALENESPSADGLSIISPLVDYERCVRVFGSADGVAWTPLVDKGLLFDYSRYVDIRNREIRLPKNSSRQYKIVVADVVDAKELPLRQLIRKQQGGNETERIEKSILERRPFRIDRIETWREVSRKASESEKTVDYAVADHRVEQDAEKKDTIVYFHTKCQPLTEVTLETPSRNFVRSVELQMPVTRGTQTEWSTIAQGQVSLLDFGGERKESLAVSCSEHREREYRLVIHNADSPPLEISGVKAKGNSYRVVFLAAAGETYRLYYGAKKIDSPSYDAVAVLAPLRQGHAAKEARLGDETANAAAARPSAISLSDVLNNPVVLGAVIVVLVAVLGAALYFAARRVDAIPEDNRNEPRHGS